MLSQQMLYLETLYPGLAVIPVVKAGSCLSFAYQTTRNKLLAGQFPLPTHLIGGKRVVKKTDLAAYLDSLSAKQTRAGRPKGSTKAAKMEGMNNGTSARS